MGQTLTNGNVIVENIKIGDIHYEFEYNMGIKCKVITLPICDDEGCWHWKAENVNTGKSIDYTVCKRYTHYSAKLYDYEAYSVSKWI